MKQMNLSSHPIKRAADTLLLFAFSVLVFACIRPAEDRSNSDFSVGVEDNAVFSLVVVDGQAHIRESLQRDIILWAQAPVLELQLEIRQRGRLRLEVRNCMNGSKIQIGSLAPESGTMLRPTWCQYQLNLPIGSHTLHIAPDDWQKAGTFRFANMGDIQEAMPKVDDVFKRISQTPDLQFVMSTGDVVNVGYDSEYDLFEEKLVHLNIPFYSTIGNHELASDVNRWRNRYGRFSVHFRFKATDFSYVDSGNAGLDPSLSDRLETWLEAGKDRVHIFGTHYPPLDPVGSRNSSFRSRNEAAKLLSMLAVGNVDLTLYGHLHSFYQFQNAGIPAYISGGGGALPEQFDGIERHFLVIEVDSSIAKVTDVKMVQVD